jgi:hypothetical protein
MARLNSILYNLHIIGSNFEMKFKDAMAYSIENLSSPEFKERVKEEDATMLKHIPILKEINALGYITHDSQAGRKHSGNSPSNGRYYEYHERAYIMGFMLESVATQFIQKMGLETDKNAVYVHPTDDYDSPVGMGVPLTVDVGGNLPSVDTSMHSVIGIETWEMYRKDARINKTEKIVYVFCWDPLWNRAASGAKGLFTEVLNVLKTVKG